MPIPKKKYFWILELVKIIMWKTIMLTIKYAQSCGLIFWKQIFVLIYNFIVLGNNLILFESRLVYLTSINMV